jgi:nucleoside 2-deoxyribosyltransferase
MPPYIFQNAAAKIPLRILVFGPNPKAALKAPTVKVGKIAQKRIEIRDWLKSEGHEVLFPEDVYSKAPPALNVAAQELMMMRDCDFIVIIVESPGSNVELGVLSSHADLAQKTHAFIDKTFKTGYAYASCQLLKEISGAFYPYSYPKDIDGCHLKTKVQRTVRRLQLVKYLS